MFRRRLDLWLPDYALTAFARASARRRRQDRLTHVMFLVCDHFEPRHGVANEEQAFERLRAWRSGYASFQQRCRAGFGNSPLHTWFYPPHHGAEHLATLSEMVFAGLGEVELHYHHGDDTAQSLRSALQAVLAEYRRWGMLLESGDDPRAAFGFVHGDWALDNSGHSNICGVNGELSILQELGCWGDFTMPSGNACQTRKINSIYYAIDDPRRSKSHDWGTDARVGRRDPAGFFLMQGPLGINWHAPKWPRIENASLTTENWGRPDRIRKWLECNVHVKGKPEWLFVKLHAHGAIEKDFDALFGEKAYEMHRHLNAQFNDGRGYRLHYVTARQAYNIAKAAEHGMEGDPSDWLDYVIRPQPHAYYALDAPHDLGACTKDRLRLSNIAAGRAVTLSTRIGPIEKLEGPVSTIEIDGAEPCLRLGIRESRAEIMLTLGRDFRPERIEGGSILDQPRAAAGGAWRLAVGSQCEIKLGALQGLRAAPGPS